MHRGIARWFPSVRPAGHAALDSSRGPSHGSGDLSILRPTTASRPDLRLLLLLLPLLLVVLAGCSRVRNPEGWSGGTIAGDVLYIGTAEGEVLALDRATGETLWRFPLRGEESDRAIYGRPTLADDILYIGGYDGFLYAVNLDGDLLGDEQVGRPSERDEEPVVGSPVVNDGLVLVGSSDSHLYAFAIEKEQDDVEFLEEWSFKTGDKVWSTPAVADGVVYFGSLDHNVYALNVVNGNKIWEFETGGAVAASPIVSGGRVYVGSFDGVFYAINAATGREDWKFTGADNWFWGGAIIDGEAVYVPSLDGNLYALDQRTGRQLWTLETEGAILGAPVIVHDMLAVPSDDGHVRMVKLRDGAERDGCNVGDGVRSALVEKDGFIYFGARDHSIRALKIKETGNPDEEWVHFTDQSDPLPRDRTPDC